jgi:tRNA (Thr-GGU) A37 N-methylase
MDLSGPHITDTSCARTSITWLEVRPRFVGGIEEITRGDTIIVVTWLHQGRRDVLRVHPRDDAQNLRR